MVDYQKDIDYIYYCRMVDRAFSDKRNKLFSNGKPEHAAYLIEKFFNQAQSSVRLYSGNLRRQWNGVKVFGSTAIINAVLDYLYRKGTRLHILLNDEIDGGSVNNHPLIRSIIANDLQNSFRLNKVRDQSWFPYHFIVMDRTSFRVETEQDDIKALANAYDRDMASQLETCFDTLVSTRSEYVRLASA